MTFVAQNMGAGQYKRMKKSVLYCLIVVIAVGLSAGTAIHLFSSPLLGIYSPGNPHVIQFGNVRLLVMCTTYFLCGIMEVGCATLRAIGKSFTSMIISLVGSCALRIVWIFTIFSWLPKEDTVENTVFRLTMLYLSYPITWIITSAVLFITCGFCFRRYRRTHFKEIKDLPQVSNG
jgi:Na+-driven multidrug efflux pump